MNDGISASGNSVAAGRDILGPVIIQNIQNVFDAAPRSLQSHMIKAAFRTIIEQRTRSFVGRDFLFQAVNTFIHNPPFPSGYLIIHGEPGIGKTSIMAMLVAILECVHHFNIHLQNIRTTRDFLGNICAQLAAAYNLGHTMLPPEALEHSGTLQAWLDEAAQRRGDKPVLVIIDALDEAETTNLSSDANVLLLPHTLPEGVFFIVSTREQIDYHLDVAHHYDIYVRDDDPENQADVRTYITKFLHQHTESMIPILLHWKVTEDDFVEQLTLKSEGNFMYIVLVLDDIRTGNLGPDTLKIVSDLPKGLRAYYQRHWRRMQLEDQARFERLYRPVICHLASAFEPVSADQIGDWSDLTTYEVREVIARWRQFFNVEEHLSAPPLYRLYHTSFQDFLREEVGLREFHGNIANRALAKVLPETRDNNDVTDAQESSDTPTGVFAHLRNLFSKRR